MALISDVYIVEYGVPPNNSILNFPVAASQTIYRGSIALTNAAGFLKSSASPLSTDTCWGVVDTGGPGYLNTGPGIISGTTAGAISADVRVGSFYLASDGTLSQSTVGEAVYVLNEITVTRTAGSLPAGGTHIFVDPAPPPTAMGPFVIKLGIGGP